MTPPKYLTVAGRVPRWTRNFLCENTRGDVEVVRRVILGGPSPVEGCRGLTQDKGRYLPHLLSRVLLECVTSRVFDIDSRKKSLAFLFAKGLCNRRLHAERSCKARTDEGNHQLDLLLGVLVLSDQEPPESRYSIIRLFNPPLLCLGALQILSSLCSHDL